MAKDYDLVFQDSNTGALKNAGNVINRRQFLRYGFNTAAGVLTASLGVLGFASILLPPGEGTAGVSQSALMVSRQIMATKGRRLDVPILSR